MKTRLFALILVFILCLCACSGNTTKETGNSGSGQNVTSPATTDDPAQDKSTPAVTNEPEPNAATPAVTDEPEPDTTTPAVTDEPKVTDDVSPTAEAESPEPMELKAEWKQDQVFTLADPAPWNLNELKKAVDVNDPRSVAAYWVWAVTRLTDDYDDGMEMMKYLFADIEVFGSGYTEGGFSGKAGWDTYFNERLDNTDYSWLPRAYFEGCTKDNGFKPDRPMSIELYYNDANTETINGQTLDAYNRLNIVYWVQSYAGGNQVNIELSRFDGTNRWYVTNGTASSALFYMQPANAKAKDIPNDDSTQAEHDAYYGSLN